TSLHDSDGQLMGFIKITRDLTERKLAEDKLRAYASELETRNKELEQFTYITSHDLQEPLRKIRVFAETAKRSAGNAKTLSAGLKRIDAAAEKMSALIRSLADYTDLTSGGAGKSDVDLNDVLDEVKARLSQRIEAGNASITADQLPVVKAIPLQMNQLLTNLIDNGLKFSGDKPMLTISARVVEMSELLDTPAHL